MVRLPRNEKQISIELKASNVTIRYDLGHHLDLEFSRSNMEFAISQPKMVRLPRNKKQIYGLNFRPQMWPSDLTLAITLTFNFQGRIWNLLYLNQKWSNFHETKSKYIDWIPGLKCDQWVWLWSWPWPLNFQGQMWPWPLTTHMTLTMDFFMVKLWNSCISEWEVLTLNKGGGSRSFMAVTIWWPRSGVRIYQLVTGVTSDVSVPSTHLVDFIFVMHIHSGKTLDAFENQHRSSLNMHIFTQLLIFALWSFLRPFFKLEH